MTCQSGAAQTCRGAWLRVVHTLESRVRSHRSTSYPRPRAEPTNERRRKAGATDPLSLSLLLLLRRSNKGKTSLRDQSRPPTATLAVRRLDPDSGSDPRVGSRHAGPLRGPSAKTNRDVFVPPSEQRTTERNRRRERAIQA